MATGEQPWRDPETGGIRTNGFYEGTAVHLIRYDDSTPGTTNRLGFQGGLRQVRSPSGSSWSGGPGYAILDETTNGLSHVAGAISMVQAGPHTGASEFLVTCTNAEIYWDGLQTVFGLVVSNLAVVEAIANQPMSNGVPLAGITVSNIVIRRVGAAAEAFDITAWELPEVTASEVELLVGGGTNLSSIAYDVPPQSEYFVIHTSNLLNDSWTMDSAGFHSGTNETRMTNSFSAEGFGPVYFFHAVQAAYAVFSAIPLGNGLVFAAEWSDGTVHQYQLDLRGAWGNATGTWVTVSNGSPIASGVVSGLRWRTRTANSSEFDFFDNVGNRLDYTLGFDASGSRTGRFEVIAKDVLFGTVLGTEFGVCEYVDWTPGVTARPDTTKQAATGAPTGGWPEQTYSSGDWPEPADWKRDGATTVRGFRPRP